MGEGPANCCRQAGYVVNVTEVVAVEVDDRPGGLAGLLECLESSGVNIEYMYAFTFGREGRAVLIFRFDRPDAAIEHLRGSASTCWGRSNCERFARRAEQMERSSWIRRMFEIGIELRRERGAGERLRFHAGESRRGAARGRDRGLAADGGGKPPAQPRLHAQRGLSRGARRHRAMAGRAHRRALRRAGPDHDGRARPGPSISCSRRSSIPATKSSS